MEPEGRPAAAAPPSSRRGAVVRACEGLAKVTVRIGQPIRRCLYRASRRISQAGMSAHEKEFAKQMAAFAAELRRFRLRLEEELQSSGALARVTSESDSQTLHIPG